MRPAARAAITAGAVILVAAIGLTIRSLNAFGVFTDVVPGFAGTCRAIPTAPGPEDIAIDEVSGLIFVSTLDRRAKARTGKPNPQDGLYVSSLKFPIVTVPGAKPNALTFDLTKTSDSTYIPLTKLAGTPSDFHPHGISLVRSPDGSLTLMAINHRNDGTSSVDIFDVALKETMVSVNEEGSIQGGQLVSPNAIAALDRNRFYVTNDHTSATQLGRTLDDDLVLPRANVLYFDGSVFHVVASSLVFPSGAVLSPDDKYLYVTESYNRRLTTYERQPLSGALDVVNTLDIPSNLDNLRQDAAGNLWIGSHPKAFDMAAYRGDATKPAPSEIFKVTLANGIPQGAALVYANLGGEIGASSVAAVTGHTMLIGSPFDAKILDCTMDH